MSEHTPPLIYLASSSHDAPFRVALEKHLTTFVTRQHIRLCHRHQIPPGVDTHQAGKTMRAEASLLLFFLSADFLTECEEDIAFARSAGSSVSILPILVHTVNLQGTPFERLQCLPRTGLPLAESRSREKALYAIVNEILTLLAAPSAPRSARERKLRALCADHQGFINDRLASFVGRQQELLDIQHRISMTMPTGGYVTMTGQAGQGKSSLMATLVEHAKAQQHTDLIAAHFIPLTPGPDHQVGLLRNLMARLILKYDLADLYVASESRAALRDYFPRVLQDIATLGKHEVIFLDGLDQLEEDLNGVRDLSFLPTNPPAGIVFVLGTRPDDTLRPLDLLKPRTEYRLPALSRADFDLLLAQRHVHLDPLVVDHCYTAMGRNALFLDLLAQEVALAVGDDTPMSPQEVVARLARNPNHLFTLSIDRLKRQHLVWRQVLKPLLGVLLVAREPLGLRPLRSILQIDDEQLRDALRALGGLLTNTGQHHYTLFHLKLREHLRQDAHQPEQDYVFATDEEEGWHASLATWCEQGGLDILWSETQEPGEHARRRYARQHLIAHHYYARQWDRLCAILDAGDYGHAKIRHEVSARTYIDDLDYGRRASRWAGGTWTLDAACKHLPRLWRYTLLRGSLRSQADQYPDALFRLLLLSGHEQEVFGQVEVLTDPARKATIFLMIAEYLATQPGRSIESQQYLQRMNDIVHSVFTYVQRENMLDTSRKLVEALIHAQRWQQAEDVARSIPGSDRRSINQVDALRAVADALSHAHLWQHATEIADSLSWGFYQAMALSTIADALSHAQQGHQAEAAWKHAEDMARSLTDPNQRVEALSALAEALTQAHRFTQAAPLWKQAKDIAHALSENYTLLQLTRALAHARRWKQAEATARSISNSYQTQALENVVEALARARRWQQAEAIAYSIPKSSLQEYVLVGIVAARAHAHHWVQAKKVAHSISARDIQASALKAIVKARAHAHQWQQAEAVARSISARDVQAEALHTIVRALTHTHLWQQAEAVACSISARDVQAEALSELGIALMEQRQARNIERLCTTATDMARSLSGSRQHVEALAALAKAHTHLGHQAEPLWKHATAMAHSISESSEQASALSTLAHALAHAHQWQQAEAVARSISESSEQANALSTLAHALAHAHQWQQAEAVARSISARDVQDYALSTLVEALAHAHLWQQAEAIAHSISGSFQRAIASIALADALTHAHLWQQAEPLWKLATAMAHSISGNDIEHAQEFDIKHAQELSYIVRALANAQRWQQAENIARSIPASVQQAEALSALAEALSHAHLWDQAEPLCKQVEDIARSIAQPDDSAWALHSVVRALIHAQRWQQAEDVARSISWNPWSQWQASALRLLAEALAQAQQWHHAEDIARSISSSDQQAMALADVIALCFTQGEYERGYALIEQSWLQAETSTYALTIFSAAAERLVTLKPALGLTLFQEFQWVENFLHEPVVKREEEESGHIEDILHHQNDPTLDT